MDVITLINFVWIVENYEYHWLASLRNQYPSLKFSDVFNSPTDEIAATAETSSENSVCYQALGQNLGNAMGIYLDKNKTLEGYPRTKTNFMSIPSVTSFLATDSQPLQKKVSTPIIIYQGTLDKTVPKPVTDFLVNSAKSVGTEIPSSNYRVGDWDHGTAYVLYIENIVNDVKSVMPASN